MLKVVVETELLLVVAEEGVVPPFPSPALPSRKASHAGMAGKRVTTTIQNSHFGDRLEPGEVAIAGTVPRH